MRAVPHRGTAPVRSDLFTPSGAGRSDRLGHEQSVGKLPDSCCAGVPGFEPELTESKSVVLPDTPHPNEVPSVGVEPTTFRLEDGSSSAEVRRQAIRNERKEGESNSQGLLYLNCFQDRCRRQSACPSSKPLSWLCPQRDLNPHPSRSKRDASASWAMRAERMAGFEPASSLWKSEILGH